MTESDKPVDTKQSAPTKETASSSAVTLSLVPDPTTEAFVFGDYTITNEPTEVPADVADDILAAAEAAGVNVQEVKE